MKENAVEIDEYPVQPPVLAELLIKVLAGEVDRSRGRDVLAAMVDTGKRADVIMKEMGIEQIDESDLVGLCRELLDANPKIVADVKGGKAQAVGALIGQAKKRNPNVNPGRVREILLELIQKA